MYAYVGNDDHGTNFDACQEERDCQEEKVRGNSMH
jgi:hypothetical protein